MAGRPRKDEKKKGRSRNGTGTITEYMQKVDKKDKRSNRICNICSKCTHQEICNFRVGTKKCKICQECFNKDDCDRFYMYPRKSAYAPQRKGQKRKYLGSFSNKKQAQNSIDKSKNGGFVDKSNITVSDLLKKIEKRKYEANSITKSTYIRNDSVIKKICKNGIGNLKIQNLSLEDVQSYLNSVGKECSQSELEKNKSMLHQCIKYAIRLNLIKENPFENEDYIEVNSDKDVKRAEPFTFEQREKLFAYMENNKVLTDKRSKLDSTTFKNVVELAFHCGQRIGEILRFTRR